MADPKGFLKYSRQLPERRPVDERVKDFREIERHLPVVGVREQGARCMGCGIPFCTSGCPLGNVIPDFNDLVHRDRWRQAIDVLHATNNFPEMTGRVCPAPCEQACVLNLEGAPVTIEHIEMEIADRAFEEGWVTPQPAPEKTGKHIAVVGSGPAGLACAQQLARAGHDVTVFERDDRIGGLLRYGIPDFKMEKHHVDRRVAQMEAEGVVFRTGVEVGRDVSAEDLRSQHDAVVLATGATVPRDLEVPGRALPGVHLAMDFLGPQNRLVAGDNVTDAPRADGKRVVILGGGDTGSDCHGTSLRQGAANVRSIELMPQPPESPDPATWPAWPLVFRTSSSHEEGGERAWSVLTKRFLGETHLTGLETVRVEWDDDGVMREVTGSEETIEADLCLLALGFTGAESGLPEQLGVQQERGRVVADDTRFATDAAGVYACGDARRGQSLVVWAIWEGREAARVVDTALMGSTRLPTSPASAA
ncbi:MAG: glutamate synthase subunit beta [Sandaracinaceae bacterium]